jgi:hypothetical protein
MAGINLNSADSTQKRSVEEASLSRKTELSSVRSAEDILRLALLVCALLANLGPIYQFIGSMIWFHQFLGDYQVFWGITKVPLAQIYDHHVFAYPPTTMLLLAPFGLPAFFPSLVAWSAAGAAAITFAARRFMRPLAITLGFLTYAGIGVLLGGQISLFVGALIMAAMGTPQPRLRGLLLAAAAVIKPQSLLAAPIALVAERNWKAIAWALAAGCGFVLFSVGLFGSDIWQRWFTELPKFHAYLISRGVDRLDVGIYGLARLIGLPGWTFLLGAPLGIVTSWLVFRSEASVLDRYAAFAVSTVLMSPYTLYYDLAGLTFVCVALLLDRERSPLIWLAAAMIVSSVFASLGIGLLAVMLSVYALRQSSTHRAANDEPSQPESSPAPLHAM